MKRRSPLDILKELRQRAHASQRARLAEQIQAEKAAEAEAEQARIVLAAALQRESAERSEEDRRLGDSGITAAEGQRRIAWEYTLRQSRAELTQELDRAVESHREALLREEQARREVQRTDAELKEVQERLDGLARARERVLERVQQENVDESSLRRFLERSGT